VHVENSGPNTRIWQCAPVRSSAKYNAGLRLLQAANCAVELYPAPNCGGVPTATVGEEALLWLNYQWTESPCEVSFQTSFDTVSARLSCYSSQAKDFYIDQAFIAPSPGVF
jgi:hypothetical protein